MYDATSANCAAQHSDAVSPFALTWAGVTGVRTGEVM
jgi:hypothetical protein